MTGGSPNLAAWLQWGATRDIVSHTHSDDRVATREADNVTNGTAPRSGIDYPLDRAETRNLEPETWNLEPATCNLQPETRGLTAYFFESR
jgi:hypothetical protein